MTVKLWDSNARFGAFIFLGAQISERSEAITRA